MKKRIYYVISSLILIVISAIVILHADEIIEQTIKVFEGMPGNFSERVLKLFNNSGTIFIIGSEGVTILLNAYIIYLAITDKLIRYKGVVISISIYNFIVSNSKIGQLVAAINIIVMAFTKRERKKDFPEKKKKLPALKKEKVTREKIVQGVVLFAFYFSQLIWGEYLPVNIVGKIILIVFYLLLIGLSILFFYDVLIDSFRAFVKNFKAYRQFIIPKMGIFYLIYFAATLVVLIATKGNLGSNQSSVEEIPLFLLVPLSLIYAPIVEESLFRGSIRRFVKDDRLFIILSAITFGLLHTISIEENIFNMIVMAIPYGTMGGFLAYIYVKTNNICSNMAFHAFHNALSLIVTLLVLGI